MEGKRAHVSLNLIFPLILMSLFSGNHWLNTENELCIRKSYISVFKTSESKPLILKRTNMSLIIMDTFKG